MMVIIVRHLDLQPWIRLVHWSYWKTAGRAPPARSLAGAWRGGARGGPPGSEHWVPWAIQRFHPRHDAGELDRRLRLQVLSSIPCERAGPPCRWFWGQLSIFINDDSSTQQGLPESNDGWLVDCQLMPMSGTMNPTVPQQPCKCIHHNWQLGSPSFIQ